MLSSALLESLEMKPEPDSTDSKHQGKALGSNRRNNHRSSGVPFEDNMSMNTYRYKYICTFSATIRPESGAVVAQNSQPNTRSSPLCETVHPADTSVGQRRNHDSQDLV